MADTDCASESASSIGDEERVRRLFQACDANGDGYIDSHDLLAVCRELSLEDSLDELMQELGADSQGRISYEQFLNRRLALRPEIDALKVTNKDTVSDNSQGKLDSWEWDSGARDMSPVPKNIIKKFNTERIMDEEYFKPVEQAGFRKGCSTIDHIQSIRTLIEKCTEYNIPLHLAFVDYHKAFDSVETWAVLDAMHNARIDSRYTRIISHTYENATMQVKIDDELRTEKIPINRGVRQVDPIFPKLFTLALEDIFKKLPWQDKSISIDGKHLNHLRFADDIVIISSNDSEELSILIKELKLGYILENPNVPISLKRTLKLSPRSHQDEITRLSPSPTSNTHMHPNFLYGKILPDGRPNFLTDYGFNFQNYGPLGTNHSKCCVTGPFANDLNFGHLYTISKAEKEERTYDEPYTGDLSRRSWFCCPGSQPRVDCEQPPLLHDSKSPTTPSDIITKAPGHIPICNGTCERLQIQLDEQSQRYEEQLTELHSVIAELTRKLHQQRTMAITEEDEISESCTSAHEESITCPLEVSELEPLENELSDLENKIPLAESPLELPEPKLITSNQGNSDPSPSSEILEPLKQEIISLKQQLHEAHTRLAQLTLSRIEAGDEETVTCKDDIECLKKNMHNSKEHGLDNYKIFSEDCKTLDSPESHIEVDCEPKSYHEDKADIKFSNIVPIHKTSIMKTEAFNIPVTKVAERIKLKRSADRDVNPNDLLNTELSTAVAEHIVGDILRQCDAHTEKQSLDFEIRKVNAKLEHARSQNTVLALTLSETKAHCDRLALLCGKYESNAIALRLSLGITDRTIEAYDVLLALLETELSINEENPLTVQNRTAAETVAKQLLSHLDSHQNSDVLLSPWQNHVYSTPIEINEPWTSEHELRLREHVSRLKAERSNIQGTYVTLESTQVENAPVRPSSSQEARKMDLEMAVLMQELMGLREDKTELLSKLFIIEKDKNALEIKLKYVEGQQKAQSATLKNLQGQLKDTEALLALATQHKERGYCDAEHAQGVELELMQALAREARLKVRLQELVTTLEQVTKNAEARLLEGREIVQDLNHTNSILSDTVDRNNKKYQAKFKKMEHQMLNMAEKHTAQVHTLQQRIATLETPPTNSSENSLNSIPM